MKTAAGHSGFAGTTNTINSLAGSAGEQLMIPAGECSGFDGHMGLARHRAFLGTSALLFIASVATTIYLCQSMAGGMAMPGGWTMSMAWMKMQGQSWLASAASFMGMWVVMMAAMMLPALVPTLLRYRLALREPERIYRGALTVIAGAGYFFVWAVLGAVVYPFGVLVAKAGMSSTELSRSMPFAAGMVLLLAGGLQLTAWKARQLCRCRAVPTFRQMNHGARSAWAHGMQLGADCALCCSGLMAVLLVTGVMNLGAMALVTIAITAERLFPEQERAARGAGLVIIATGVFMIGRAMSAHLSS
jgi:predicted metal-binding membrane protein